MDKLAKKELLKFSLLSVGICLAGIAAYHFFIVKDDDEKQLAEKAKEKEKEK